MAYTKTIWQNDVTPINDTNLNHIEDGIEELDNNLSETVVDSLDTSSPTKAPSTHIVLETFYTKQEINSLLNNKKDKELSYIVATTSATQAITSNYQVNLDSIARSNGNFTLNNGAIKIGAGINHVRVSGGLFVNNWSAGGNYLWGQIKKNGSTTSSCIVSSNSSYISSNISATIIPVQEGDTITILADAGAGGNLRSGAGNTWVCVEKID